MNAVSKRRTRSFARFMPTGYLLCFGLALLATLAPRVNAEERAKPTSVQVRLDEWKVSLTPETVPPGPVVFEVTNTGKVPHALEIEGRGVEKSTPRIMPGASATLALDLRDGAYEAYCPVGKGSHKMLGMTNRLSVGETKQASAENDAAQVKGGKDDDDEYAGGGDDDDAEYATEHAAMHDMRAMAPAQGAEGGVKIIKVVGGGPVIQILPGPFPFADSAMAVIQSRPEDQKADLAKKAHMGPYSNNVAKIAGQISILAIDRGAAGDSVSGVAQFTAKDGARWKLVMDRVQTKDIPYNPRFGGVIMGLFYHGASNVHTPLVPTIQSSVALWSIAHLYKNDQLVTDNAMVHVMLLSRTRRTSDWALDCWDCSERPVEELQLQVTSAPGTPPFDTPGGFLFVNWEKSSGKAEAM
ncbi:MAG TPA: hypothetical protein VF363_01980 [Candidatus Eisenbacteria bacterium]